jgi:acetyl-CoA acetyltransferase
MGKLLGREVAVLGVGMHPFGKFPEKSPHQLGCEAVLGALKDADLRWRDIQYLVASVTPEIKGNESILPGQVLCEKMGELGIPVINVSNVCASGGVALKVAYQAIALGECDTALVVGFDCSPDGFFLGAGGGTETINDGNFMRWRIVGASNPSHWALECRKRMDKYGTTERTLAMTKVLASRNSVHNPNARYKKAFMVEEVLSSPMVCEPLRLLEICATSDGAAAVILGSMEMARKRSTKVIQVAAAAISHAQYGDGTLYPVAVGFHGRQQTPVASEAHVTACAAYEQAGIGPEDLDLVELPDNSAWHYLNYMECLGLAKEGEADQLVLEEQTAVGGKIPCCTSGGFASFGETTAAMGQFQVCELVWQLRGTAGPRQVKGARVALGQLYGGNGNSSVTILKT